MGVSVSVKPMLSVERATGVLLDTSDSLTVNVSNVLGTGVNHREIVIPSTNV